MLDMLEKHATEGIKDDPAVVMSLWDRIHLPDGDANKITDPALLNQYMGRGMKLETVMQLRKEMIGAQTPEGKIEAELKAQMLTTAKAMLTKTDPMTGLPDPIGAEQYQKYMNFFLHQYQEERKKGVPVRDLLDPNGKAYLGHEIRKYVRPNDKILDDIIRRSLGGQAPAVEIPDDQKRQEGESIGAWRKRTGR
jgi:hypothetical protein